MEKGQARKGQKRKMEKREKTHRSPAVSSPIRRPTAPRRGPVGQWQPRLRSGTCRRSGGAADTASPPGLAQGTGSADRGGAAIFTGGPTVLGTAGRPVAGVSGGAAAGAWALAGGAARSSLMAARRRARTRP